MMRKRVLLGIALVGFFASSVYALPSYRYANVWYEHRQYDSYYTVPDTYTEIFADATLGLESGDDPESINVSVSWDGNTEQLSYLAEYFGDYEYTAVLAENPSSLSEWETTYQFLIHETGATSDSTIGAGQFDANDFAIPTLEDDWTFEWNAVDAAEGARMRYRIRIIDWADGDHPFSRPEDDVANSGFLESLSYTLDAPLSPGEYAIRMEAIEDFGGHFVNRSTYFTYLNVSAGVSKMYWASYGKIQRANLNGSNVEELVTGLSSVEGIALDMVNGKIYWTDEDARKIQRANFDGTGIEDLLAVSGRPQRIALDIAEGKMYWTEQTPGLIRRANLDGSDLEDLFTVLEPGGVALDLTSRKIYWTNDGAINVQRANFDGTGIEDLITGEYAFEDIALDLSGQKMYFANDGPEMIWRANLDGSNIENLVTLEGVEGDGIALDLDADRIYFTVEDGRILRANLNGAEMEELVSGLDMPGGIALFNIQPETPEEIIEEIAEEVGDMVSTDELNEGEGEALTSKLDVVMQKLNEGNDKAACNVLQAFINQINAMIKSGRLSEEEGQALIEDANSICM